MTIAPRRLHHQAQAVARRPPAQLCALFEPWIQWADAREPGTRQRLFTPAVTFWLFLAQVLAKGSACRETLRHFLVRLCAETGKTASPQTAAYCKARARLPAAELDRARRRVAEKIETKTQSNLWHGRVVKVVDGSSISMPDTPDNQRAWPQPAKQKPGCGFPVMRIVAIFSLASGALLELARGPLTVHERTLFRDRWDTLRRGDVVLADRGFGGYADFWCLAQRGVDAVMRKNARRINAGRVKNIGKNDALVRWKKSGRCPPWLDEKSWREIPEIMTVRQITVTVATPGFRARTIIIVTTLLDPHLFTAADFAELYRRRWRAELYLRDIKTTMGMEILRCKTPAMIEKELAIHLIAYNLIRALMLEAATRYRLPPERLSFQGAIATVRQWSPAIAAEMRPLIRHNLYRHLLYYLAADLLPHRPDRVEPRARKRRPKNYQLLNKPRKTFTAINHRNKYRKA